MNAQSTRMLRTKRAMPIIGLGTWELTKDTAEIVKTALDEGYRMLDTAADYGTQAAVGEAIKMSGLGREQLFIVNKVEETDDAYEATHKNLAELGLSYVDLMLIHRPPKSKAGVDLWKQLIRAKKEGLARDIGVSNYTEEEMQALIDATGEVPVVNQIEWTPFGHSGDMLEYCKDNKIIIQAYSPLTHGERLKDKTLADIADRYHKTPAQLLIHWNIQLGTVPIVKANRLEHLKQNLNVFDFKLSEADMAALERLNEEYSALGSLAYTKAPTFPLKKSYMVKFGELVKRVQSYSGYSAPESEDALELVVEHLALHLPDDQREDFANELPQELQEVALSVEPTAARDDDDIVTEFMEIEEVEQSHAEHQILSVWKALQEIMSDQVVDKIKSRLPYSMVVLLQA